MKRTVFFGLLVILMVFGFIGCDTETYTVTFNSNGGSAVAAVTGIISGSTITLPTPPIKIDNTFIGWYTDNGTFQDEFTALTVVLSDILLFAKWEYTGPKSLKITGLDIHEGYYLYVFTREEVTQPWLTGSTVATSGGTDNAVLVTNGTIIVDLFDANDLSTRWTGDGEYYICIGVMRPLPPSIYLYRTTIKVNIQKRENTTIDYRDYNWQQT